MSPSALRDAFRAVVGRGAENSAKTVLFSQTGRQAALFPQTNGERVIFAERVIPAERMMPAFEGGSEPVRVENDSKKWDSEMGADNSAEVAAAAAGNITAAGSRSARAEKSERQPGAREVAGAAKIGQMQLAGAARPEVRRVELTEISAKEAGAAGAAGLRQGAGITRQLTEAISGRVRRGEMSAFKIRLKPEGLGEVTVRLSRDGNRLEVELSAQLKSTRELIARDLDALQGALNTGNTGRFSSVSVTLGAETAQNAFAGLAGGEHGRGGRDAERWQNDAWPNISSDAEEKKPLGDIRRFTGRLIDYKV